MLRATLLALLTSALVVFAGCKDKTAILVEVSSTDINVPADVDALRFQVLAADNTMADLTFPISGTWPHSFAIYPPSGNSLPQVEVTVTGLKNGGFAVRRVARAFFAENDTRNISVVLTRSCLNVVCPDRVDCVAGACVGLSDSGVPDGSVPDGSLPDGDAGAVDGDAGTDGTVDAPVDGDADLDGCIPMGAEACGPADEDCDNNIDENLVCVGDLVISEFTTSGSNGGRDEFVELYNTTDRSLPLDGIRLEYRSQSGASFDGRAVLPAATLPPHRYYLVTGTSYSGSTPTDFAGNWTSGFAGAGGHIRIVGDEELDRIGWGGATFPEGTPAGLVLDETLNSYERKAVSTSTEASMAAGGSDASRGNGHDTDNNMADILTRTTPDPQNMMSPAEMP
ncbi:MAG: lamin tail domain-containing protein [Myxococcota bacterium]